MGEEYTRFWFSAREVRFRAELLKLVSFARTKRAGLHSDPLDDLVLLVFEQVSRLYLGYISAKSRLYLGHISALSRLYLAARHSSR